jgi:hypothetical protein
MIKEYRGSKGTTSINKYRLVIKQAVRGAISWGNPKLKSAITIGRVCLHGHTGQYCMHNNVHCFKHGSFKPHTKYCRQSKKKIEMCACMRACTRMSLLHLFASPEPTGIVHAMLICHIVRFARALPWFPPHG